MNSAGKPPATTVEQMLAPIAVQQFLAEAWKQRPLHIDGGAGRFGSLFGWDSLARILANCPLEPPRIGVMRGGKGLPEELYLKRRNGLASIDAGGLSLLLEQGATLLVNFMEDLEPGIASLASQVAETLTGRTWVNLYATWGAESALKLHSDSHDVIVLQLAGRKHWTVHGPTRVDPLNKDAFVAPPAGAEPAWSGEIQDGDVLYVPCGWPHLAVPVGEPSLHLTIAVAQPSGSDFLHWLADELDDVAEIRASIPRTARETWLAEMRRRVRQAIDPDSLSRFLSQEAARQLARPRFEFPGFARLPLERWTRETRFRLATTRCLDVHDCGDGTVSIVAEGRRLSCSLALAPALRLLSSTGDSRLERLEDGLTSSDVRELRRTLAIMMQLGLLFSES